MRKRASNTGRDMLASGAWILLSRKHYQHLSGVEIRYNSNRWVWEVLGGPMHGHAWSLLWAARHYAECPITPSVPPSIQSLLDRKEAELMAMALGSQEVH